MPLWKIRLQNESKISISLIGKCGERIVVVAGSGTEDGAQAGASYASSGCRLYGRVCVRAVGTSPGCHNICDDNMCSICADHQRDHSMVCVVENIKEVMAIENTGQFRGVYHVLGGIISPMDGIGPGDLQIDSLVQRVAEGEVKEVVLALSTTMEGDTTNFFIYRKLSSYDVKISVIARGVSIGDEIEYADEITLGRSIVNRTSFNDSIKV